MQEIFREYLNLSRRERAERAHAAAGEIVNFCGSEGLSFEESMNFLCSLTKLFVSVDRSCAQGEYDLFVEITGYEMSNDQFYEMTNYGGNQDYVQAVLELVHLMPEDVKYAVAIFGLCMCSADHEITDAEQEMIVRTIRA